MFRVIKLIVNFIETHYDVVKYVGKKLFNW